MSKNFDWIVIGAGITGAPLAYELQRQGLRVLLLEKSAPANNATGYSYGGIPYWSGTTGLTQRLCRESRTLMPELARELDGETEYRELDLMLYARPGDDLDTLKQNFHACLTAPQWLDVEAAIAKEPLLNPEAIKGTFRVVHGHVHPGKTIQAYLDAFLRQGGRRKITEVTQLLAQKTAITAVVTPQETFGADNVVICAGASSADLLRPLGVEFPLYFSHALVLQTAPTDLCLKTLVMPAQFSRLAMELRASELNWAIPSDDIQADVLEAGAIQFLQGHCLLGQISQLVTNPDYVPDRHLAERRLKTAIAEILPALALLKTTLQHCRVAFASPAPLVGPVPGWSGLHLFTGFSSPFCYAPVLARHFAQAVGGETNPILTELSLQLAQAQTK